MSGLAEILLTLHFKVSGSDQKLNAACQRLKGLGACYWEFAGAGLAGGVLVCCSH
jgi:UDP-N-acetylmuramate-alanine ligase